MQMVVSETCYFTEPWSSKIVFEHKFCLLIYMRSLFSEAFLSAFRTVLCGKLGWRATTSAVKWHFQECHKFRSFYLESLLSFLCRTNFLAWYFLRWLSTNPDGFSVGVPQLEINCQPSTLKSFSWNLARKCNLPSTIYKLFYDQKQSTSVLYLF